MLFKVLARNLSATATPRKPARRLYVAPTPPEQVPMERISQIPTLRDELVPTGTSTLPLMEDLKREYDSLTQEIGRLQDALDALVRMQRKYVRLFLTQPHISLLRERNNSRFTICINLYPGYFFKFYLRKTSFFFHIFFYQFFCK